VPQLFRDTPDTPIITYSDFTWKTGRVECMFYDVNLGRDIGRALTANMFLGMIPGESKMLLHRDLLWASENKLSDFDEFKEAMSGIGMSVFYYIKAYPILYMVDVDFSAMRESEEVTEIIEYD